MDQTHLVERSHGLVGAADLDLVEEGGGAGAIFARALSWLRKRGRVSQVKDVKERGKVVESVWLEGTQFGKRV